MLPDTLHMLDRADRRGYASILAHMASADGEITVEELSTFEGRLGNALIAPMSRKELRLELKRPKPIALAAREMSDESLLMALRDAILLAAADGLYENEEKERISAIATEAGVDQATLDTLYAWVDEGWAWMRRGRSILGLSTEGTSDAIQHEDAPEPEPAKEVESMSLDDLDEVDEAADDDDEDEEDDFEEEEYDVFEDHAESGSGLDLSDLKPQKSRPIRRR